MAKSIQGIPEFVTREQFTSFIEAFGFDPSRLVELHVFPNSVEAVVIAFNEDGNEYVEGDSFAKHRVSIPVHDEEEGK